MKKTPKLRFKEFSGDWESKPLSKYTEKITKKNKGFLVTNVISNSAKNGLISQRDFFDKDIANQNNIDGYYIIENGDFVYNPRKSLESPYGPVNRYNLEDAGVVSPLYLCFKINEKVNGKFLEYYFKSSKWYRFIYQNSDQGARHDRVSIKDSEFFKLNTQFPSIEEQEKIAFFISLIDDKISLQGEKVEALKDYKKGMIQKIFSRELRFKDDAGRYYPEWEEKKLGDIGAFTSGTGFSEKYQGYLNLPIKVFKVSDMNISGNTKYMNNANNTISYDILKEMKSKSINKPSIIFAKVGAAIFLERKRIVKTEFLIDNNMMAFIPNENNDIEFIHSLMNTIQLSRYAQVGALPSYNVSDISSIKVKIPCLDEQNKISKTLCILDNKIEREQEKLDSINEYKKGLLQQMFD